ncbi:MAG: ribosome recycling factor [Bacteroidetes bacterium]|nr:MAG: ribosome recycling factor [Bacteroidota bacterium]
MDELIKMVVDQAGDHMNKSVKHLILELQKIRAGKASPDMLDGVKVDYYGSETPLNQVANVSATDARTITISPWEKNMIPKIEKAIRDANLGFNPGSDGDAVRVPVPSLTEERRKDLVKQAKALGEHAKVAIRQVRKDSNNELKKLQKEENLSEDMIKQGEAKVQEHTDTYTKQVDDILSEKEAQIMTV